MSPKLLRQSRWGRALQKPFLLSSFPLETSLFSAEICSLAGATRALFVNMKQEALRGSLISPAAVVTTSCLTPVLERGIPWSEESGWPYFHACLTCFTSKGCEVQWPMGNQGSGNADPGQQAHGIHVGPSGFQLLISGPCSGGPHFQIQSQKHLSSLLSLPPSNYHI